MISIYSTLLVTSIITGITLAAPIQSTLDKLKDSPVTQYSSDFTKNIFVKQIHSHNDYWRDVPLYTALSYGVQSVEADVWHFNNDETIYVGHHEAALNSNRTFQSLYIDPLVEILTQANPESNLTILEEQQNGVFDTNAAATLYLFVDVKTEANSTWESIVDALEPLRERDWLTTFNASTVNYGPVTVIGTGNTPFDFVSSQETRDYFFDGPLANLTETFPNTLNPIASASLKSLVGSEISINGLNETQFETLKSYVDDAHSKGILTRVWDVSWWPVLKRDNLWRQILQAGSDFLNADDLELASTFL